MTLHTIEQISQKAVGLQISTAFVGTFHTAPILEQLPPTYHVNSFTTFQELHDFLDEQSILTLPDIMLMEIDPEGKCFEFIKKIKENPLWRDLIIVLIAAEKNKQWKLNALSLKVHDYYSLPFPIDHLLERLSFLVKFKLIKPQLSVLEKANITYKLPPGKRIFDIVFSVFGIILVSPILLITAIIIKFDSKGPIIYRSKRVGTGYTIFDFYKFRSMQKNADSQLGKLTDLNQYISEEESAKKTAFIKLKDDPRITRFGEFIRRTSIDELPQLFNVIKGDMSLVGNRPLPLYEAEMLTSNEWSLRFMGPAGVTGLWQIKSRGNKEVSERERKKFDNFYATKYSFWFDVEILIKTLPVIFHKEKF